MARSIKRVEDRPFYDILLRFVGPILIMLMIGSLVFFLIDVFYRGPHDGRLRWVFGLFTLATVLVSRISIEEGLERAALFGFLLAVATLMTSMTLVDFEYGVLAPLEPVVLILFIVVVMWSSNRLTWDCTLIDESRDVSAMGLTEVIARRFKRNKSGTKSKPTVTDEHDPEHGQPTWLSLFFVGNQVSNTPGLWVLYFALAAFPIFGFGQWFAQLDPQNSVFWIFGLFAIYLGSGLGLLMLTSLTALERYLYKRGAQIPAQVSRNWLIAGTVFALAIMISVLAIPRPNIAGNFQSSIQRLISPDREASKNALGDDGQKFEEGGKPANNDELQDQDAAPGKGEQGSPDGPSSDDSDSEPGNDEGKGSPDESSSSEQKSQNNNPNKPSNNNEESDSDESDQQNKSESQENKDADSSKSENDNEDQPDQENENQAEQPQEKNNQNRAQNRQQNDQRRPDENNAKRNQGAQRNQPPPPPPDISSRILDSFSGLARFITYAIGAVLVLVLVWMFRDELRQLWNDLFGGKKKTEETERAPEEKVPTPVVEEVPFSRFKNPFKSGDASRWTPIQSIDYTFRALESWSREQGMERSMDETPFELAAALRDVDPNVAREAQYLANLHGRCVFGSGQVNAKEIQRLSKLWLALENANRGMLVDSH